jgi:hypothetical protein
VSPASTRSPTLALICHTVPVISDLTSTRAIVAPRENAVRSRAATRRESIARLCDGAPRGIAADREFV